MRTPLSVALVAALLYPPVAIVSTSLPWTDSELTAHALVLGPTGFPNPGEGYLDAAQKYLDAAAAFHGEDAPTDLESFYTPEQNTNDSYERGLDLLEQEVLGQYHSGEISADDPLYIFGYSQSATIASEAMQAFRDEGIPQDYLRFVLIGNAAEPDRGFMGLWEELVRLFGFDNPAGVVTPTDYYQTDSYVIEGDNWADAVSSPWPGLSSLQHLEYLGLDPEQIAGADDIVLGPEFTEHFIATVDIDNPLQALFDAFMAMW